MSGAELAANFFGFLSEIKSKRIKTLDKCYEELLMINVSWFAENWRKAKLLESF